MKVLETTGEVTELKKDSQGPVYKYKLVFSGGLVAEISQNTITPVNLFGKTLKLTVITVEPIENERRCQTCGQIIMSALPDMTSQSITSAPHT